MALSDIDLRHTHILVVEDDPMMAALTRQMLSRVGASVAEAGSAAAALDAIASQEPDLIVLDLNLPDLDGLDLLAVFREHSDTPIVVLTGYVEPEFRREALELGASGFLTKPISAQVLLEAVQAALTSPAETAQIKVAQIEPAEPEPSPVVSPQVSASSYGRFITELDTNLQDADGFVRSFVQRGGQ